MPTRRTFLQPASVRTAAPLLALFSLCSISLAAPPSKPTAPATSAPSASFPLPSLLGKNLADYEAVLGQSKYVQSAPTDPSATRWTETRYYKPTVPGVQRMVLSHWVTKGADGTLAPGPLVVRVECQFAPSGPVKTWQAALQALGFSPAKASVTKGDAGKTMLALTDTPSVEHVEWHPATSGPDASSSLVFTIATPASDATASTNAASVGVETPVAPTPNFPPIDFNNLPYQQTVQQMADGWRAKYRLPGVWCAVIKDGKIVACVADGVKNIETKTPASVNDHLNVGSVSKVITGMLVAEFVAKGSISYDTTVGQVFPELVQKYPISPLLNATLRQVLSHTSGLPRKTKSFVPESFPNGLKWRYAQVEAAVKDPNLLVPGSQRVYSNFGATLAVAMTERQIGAKTTYEDWINGAEGRAVGISGTRSLDWRKSPRTDDIFPHIFEPDGSLRCQANPLPADRDAQFSSSSFYACGGSCSINLESLCRFAIDTLNNSCGLTQEVYKEAYSKCYPALLSNSSAGWQVSSDGTLYHDGNTGRGECACILINPVRKSGYVLYTNAYYPENQVIEHGNFFLNVQSDLGEAIDQPK